MSKAEVEGENPYRDEITDLRLDRLGQRLTLLTVLLPIAIVAILVLGYLDLKHRVVGLQDTGAASVQTLSDDLSSRFSTLSVRVAEMEQSLKKTLADAKAHSAEQAAGLNKLQEDLKGLESRLENQRTEGLAVKAEAEALGKQIAPLAERIAAQEQTIKASGERIEAQIKAVTGAMEAVQAKMAGLAEKFNPVQEAATAAQAEVARLTGAVKTDREAVQAALAQQKEASARQLQTAVQALEQDLGKLQRKIDQLQYTPTVAPVQPPAAVAGPSTPPPAVEPGLPDLRPGQIIEKPLP